MTWWCWTQSLIHHTVDKPHVETLVFNYVFKFNTDMSTYVSIAGGNCLPSALQAGHFRRRRCSLLRMCLSPLRCLMSKCWEECTECTGGWLQDTCTRMLYFKADLITEIHKVTQREVYWFSSQSELCLMVYINEAISRQPFVNIMYYRHLACEIK